jgi:predicted nuclease of predicted toxin-antitoxin system
MRFLADENFPGDVVRALRERGMDVAWICSDAAGSPDEAVLARSQAESRVLLTLDKDFGELVFRRGAAGSAGVIPFRIAAPSPDTNSRSISCVIVRMQDSPQSRRRRRASGRNRGSTANPEAFAKPCGSALSAPPR